MAPIAAVQPEKIVVATTTTKTRSAKWFRNLRIALVFGIAFRTAMLWRNNKGMFSYPYHDWVATPGAPKMVFNTSTLELLKLEKQQAMELERLLARQAEERQALQAGSHTLQIEVEGAAVEVKEEDDDAISMTKEEEEESKRQEEMAKREERIRREQEEILERQKATTDDSADPAETNPKRKRGIRPRRDTKKAGTVETVTHDDDDHIGIKPIQHTEEFEADTVPKYDLIIWYRQPELHKTNLSDIVVTRGYPNNYPKPYLQTLEEHLTVDFRECTASTNLCPPTTSAPAHLSRKDRQKVQQNQDRKLVVYKTMENWQGRRRTKTKAPFLQIQAVTFWSSHHKQYIPLDYSAPEHVQFCKCPVNASYIQPCLQNQNSNGYPYMRDILEAEAFGSTICKSTHPQALPPKRDYGGGCSCGSTCFTPQATDQNSTWPWKNQAQRQAFYPITHKQPAVDRQNRKCTKIRNNTTETSSYQPRFLSCPSTDNNNITLSCPAYGSFLHHLFFIPEAKLIFCGTPKVGMSEWIKFFRYSMGARDYLSLPHYKEDIKQFHMSQLGIGQAQDLLNDPTWTKAVFWRDPLERLLSAYQDKILKGVYTQTTFKIGNTTVPKSQRPRLTFEEFVDRVTDTSPQALSISSNPNGLKSSTDPHWRPQMMMCGLDHLLPQFDFIGSFNHLSEHTKLLLEKVGLWETQGVSFVGELDPQSPAHDMCALTAASTKNATAGFNQRGPSTSINHSTGSANKIKEYYTPELMEKVRKAYALDISIWEDLVSRNNRAVGDIAGGKDLRVVKDYCDEPAGNPQVA